MLNHKRILISIDLNTVKTKFALKALKIWLKLLSLAVDIMAYFSLNLGSLIH